ncbi:uncharacterized protein LY79DRAFT_85851 [Colletotrichum navitas]|uniref:Uncharacterized protein n=1 Tax=Colletotrichum navitas TaxID=681940 RepID=A0AAD8PKM7_9PEZI|nr:uncharacterized protein LY79DRAFT_85851 [Colletotrichum navitas]KAK1569486.1 hypothetical protein LY79DRAFT_85851 [Colletotrichum navitas]
MHHLQMGETSSTALAAVRFKERPKLTAFPAIGNDTYVAMRKTNLPELRQVQERMQGICSKANLRDIVLPERASPNSDQTKPRDPGVYQPTKSKRTMSTTGWHSAKSIHYSPDSSRHTYSHESPAKTLLFAMPPLLSARLLSVATAAFNARQAKIHL